MLTFTARELRVPRQSQGYDSAVPTLYESPVPAVPVRRRSRVWDFLLTGPRGLLLRVALVAAASVVVLRLHSVQDPGVLCPLRRLTGVPCPLCGSTSAFIELGAGDVRAAVAAQPVIMTLTAALVAVPMTLRRLWVRLGAPGQLWVIAVGATASWLYQLHRFGYLG